MCNSFCINSFNFIQLHAIDDKVVNPWPYMEWLKNNNDEKK